jgi:hypothetical protein
VLDSHLIPTAKGLAIWFPVGTAEARMPIFISILHIWLPVVLSIFTRSLDAVVKTLALHITLVF